MHRNQTLAIISLMGLVALLLGCSNCDVVEQENKTVVMQALDAINNHEYDKLDQFIAQDYRRHCQATPDVKVETLDEFIGMVEYWMQACPDGKQGIDMLITEGDLVAFYGVFSGTQTGSMGNIPPTGKRIDSDTFGFHRLENGKIVETWVTWDNLAILTQLGLYPPPGVETKEEQEE